MVKKIILLVTLFSLSHFTDGQNLICNGSFEISEYKNRTNFYLDDWFSINSVDLYSGPQKKGDGLSLKGILQAQDGKNYIGLSNYSLNEPNYREFIIGKNKVPLIKDHKYILNLNITYGGEMSFLCRNLYVFFLKEIPNSDDIIYTSFIDSITIPLNKIIPEKWYKYTDTLIASGETNYIGIGNLISNDRFVKVKQRSRNILCAYSYFYFDNLELIPVQLEDTVLNIPQFISEPVIPLDTIVKSFFSILFKFNSDQILEEYSDSLYMLVDTLKKTKHNVDLTGYTDSTGMQNHNLILSRNRVKTIYRYLIKNGIEDGRITTSFRGSNNPLNENILEQDRVLNRRVEIKIIK